MTKEGLNKRSSNTLHNWLITLSIFFISFFGVILALIFIFALPDKTVRPLEGSLFYISSSVIVVTFLFLRWKKETAQENEILNETLSGTQKIVINENISDKIIKWMVTIFSFLYAFCGLAIALICIFALPDKSVQPKIGIYYFLGSAIVIGSFIFVVWKNWISRKP
jgi:phage shock protein PspC (stress-responsive transcriptional regulator)